MPAKGEGGRNKCLCLCRERKEGERQQLADLVGKNLTYISQLEGLDFKLYQVLSILGHEEYLCKLSGCLVTHFKKIVFEHCPEYMPAQGDDRTLCATGGRARPHDGAGRQLQG